MYRDLKQASSKEVIDFNSPIKYDYKANLAEAEELLQNRKSELYDFEVQELEHYLKLVKENPSLENNNLLLSDSLCAVVKRLRTKEYSNKTIDLLETLPSPLDIVLGKAQYSIHQFLSNCLVVFESRFINRNFDLERFNEMTKFITDELNEVNRKINFEEILQEYKNLRVKRNFGRCFEDPNFDSAKSEASEDLWREIGYYELLFRITAEIIREYIICENDGNFQKRGLQKDLDKFKNSYLEFQLASWVDLEYIENFQKNRSADLRDYEDKYFYYELERSGIKV